MTRSEIFKAAHKLAKTFVGSYVACFALALKSVYKSIKEKAKMITEYKKFKIDEETIASEGISGLCISKLYKGRYEFVAFLELDTTTNKWFTHKLSKKWCKSPSSIIDADTVEGLLDLIEKQVPRSPIKR